MALPPLKHRSLPNLVEELERLQNVLKDLSSYKDPEVQGAIARTSAMEKLLDAIEAINAEIAKRTGG